MPVGAGVLLAPSSGISQFIVRQDYKNDFDNFIDSTKCVYLPVG